MSAQPECPECEKLTQVSEESQRIGFFLEWLSNQGIVLSKYDHDFSGTLRDSEGNEEDCDEMLMPAWEYKGDTGINKLLAEYFDIDLNKVEEERRALLKWLQEQQ